MERIELTDEMRSRILRNIDGAAERRRPARLISARRSLAAAACLVVVLLGVFALGRPGGEPEPSETDVLTYYTAPEELPDAGTLSAAVGFDVSEAGYLPFEPEETSYISLWGDIAEIIYEGSGLRADLRKARGSGDISGDWNEYPEKVQLVLGDISAELRGEDGRYVLAVWESGGFAYSTQLDSAQTQDVWADIIDGIK